MFLGAECRIGEAKTPGPAAAGDTWSLGVCNPSGLQGKSVLLAGVDTDVIAVCETHLTTTARSVLQHSLKSHSQYSHVITGSPLPARINTNDAGQYSGVATIARVPARALCACWPQDLFETGRVQITGTFINQTWITGAVMYGYPQGKVHHNALARSSEMLEFLISHMTQVASGPRYLCGDLNHEMDQLPALQRLVQLGWREAQDLECLRTGTQPQPTCKGCTRKDMLWISPELVPFFRCAFVDHDRFADHSVLRAFFALDGALSKRYLWPKPKPVPWNVVPPLDQPVDFAEGSPTEVYKQLWQAKEALAKDHLGEQWQYQMQGRGQRTEPLVRRGWAAPPRKGRSSDFQPAFHGYNVQHSRWLRQLRRLHNYHRWAMHHYGTAVANQQLHGTMLWASVLKATGFGPSFQAWWISRQCIGLQDPASVPTLPPDANHACQLCEAFQGELRAFERTLNAAKKAAKVCAHKRNQNLIYKDTKRPTPEPVTSLLVTKKAKVAEIRPEDSAVLLDQPVLFDAQDPVVVGNMPTTIIHATADTLYLSDIADAQVGHQVTHTQPVGALDEVFAVFHTQWKLRWCKHDDIPHSHWDQLVRFARHHLPRHDLVPVNITPDLLRAEVASKKSQAATGLDGVSRADILHLDRNSLTSLCQLYHRACSDGSWPLQTVTGSVASLAKREGAASTQDYRPITIFSMVYRAFSSLHARCMLDQANQWCHPDIYGNRKGHQTSQLWRVLVSSSQQAYDQNQCLSGLTADIEKCFNCLPRYPIIAAALQVGTPLSTMTAWCGALAAMTRRFKVRDSYSTGFTTSTGLAEGCALSCYGMLIMDDIMHRYIAAQYPLLRVLSFVDNWDFITWNAQAATQQLDALLEFASLADLTVDRQKTYAWSTSAEVRANLRSLGIPVKHAAKDLGAHVAFSRQHTNSTVTSRLDALTPFWTQLRQSRASYRSKLRALRTVAWPRGLFAVESAPISDNTWLCQRRHANKALSMDKPGVNPMLLLGLVEAYVDPEFVALIRTVGETRLNCPLDFWASDLFPLAAGITNSPPSSPAAVLLGRIQKVGIAIKPTGHWEDRIGLFHPAHVNFAELCHRLQWQWHQYVCAAVSHRKDFHGLDMVDTTTTRQAINRLAVDDQSMLRLSLAGGLFTQDAHVHWNEGTGSCKWCGQLDSLRHRYFECPNTLDLRTSLAPDVLPLLDLLPEAMVLRSWAIYPPTHLAWLRLLDSVPCAVPSLACAFKPGVLNHVFTDGSCLWQADPAFRVASWAAILADPCSPVWNFSCGGVLGAGHVPGLCQTSYRGELFALAVILHHAALGAFRVKVCCDCLGVVNKYHRLTSGRTALKPNSASADLWTWVLASVAMLGTDGCEVVKIPAHRKLHQAKSRTEVWQFWHNNVVDGVAKHANLDRSPQFWDQWKLHVDQTMAARVLHEQVCALHIAVARRSVQTEAQVTLDEVPIAQPRQLRIFPVEFNTAAWRGDIPLKFATAYGAGLARRICRWWQARTTSDDAGETRWISFAHLYVDYQLTFGCPGPVKHGAQWLDAQTRPYLDPERHPFLVRLKWFRRCLNMFWKLTGQTVGMNACKVEGDSIQSFVNAASIRWCYFSWSGAEHWIATACKGPCCRGTRALEALPLARRQAKFALLDEALFHGTDCA